MTPSIEGLPTKAKEVRLAPLGTNQVFKCLKKMFLLYSLYFKFYSLSVLHIYYSIIM